MERLDHVLARAIGARVRTLRTESGLSQGALAQRASTHRPIICRIERGVHVPDLETMHRLASALGCEWKVFTKGIDWTPVDSVAKANLRECA